MDEPPDSERYREVLRGDLLSWLLPVRERSELDPPLPLLGAHEVHLQEQVEVVVVVDAGRHRPTPLGLWSRPARSLGEEKKGRAQHQGRPNPSYRVLPRGPSGSYPSAVESWETGAVAGDSWRRGTGPRPPLSGGQEPHSSGEEVGVVAHRPSRVPVRSLGQWGEEESGRLRWCRPLGDHGGSPKTDTPTLHLPKTGSSGGSPGLNVRGQDRGCHRVEGRVGLRSGGTDEPARGSRPSPVHRHE